MKQIISTLMLLRSIHVSLIIMTYFFNWWKAYFFTVQDSLEVSAPWSLIVAQHCHLLIHTDIAKKPNIMLNLSVKTHFP